MLFFRHLNMLPVVVPRHLNVFSHLVPRCLSKLLICPSISRSTRSRIIKKQTMKAVASSSHGGAEPSAYTVDTASVTSVVMRAGEHGATGRWAGPGDLAGLATWDLAGLATWDVFASSSAIERRSEVGLRDVVSSALQESACAVPPGLFVVSVIAGRRRWLAGCFNKQCIGLETKPFNWLLVSRLPDMVVQLTSR